MAKESESATSHIGMPLRRAGQQLDEEWSELVNEGLLFWVMAAFLPAVFALLEWFRVWLHLAPFPGPLTVVAVLALIVALSRIIRLCSRARDLSLGIRGEKVVADRLERLRALGYHVFHDLQGDGFNVDHVLVGPGGVFVIETKARSKRHGRAVVTYQRDKVLVDGLPPDRDPIDQVRRLSREVAKVIRDECGLQVKVRPVVIFPGWYVEGSSSGRDVWVFNEKGLEGFVRHEARSLGAQEVANIARALDRRNRQPRPSTS